MAGRINKVSRLLFSNFDFYVIFMIFGKKNSTLIWLTIFLNISFDFSAFLVHHAEEKRLKTIPGWCQNTKKWNVENTKSSNPSAPLRRRSTPWSPLMTKRTSLTHCPPSTLSGFMIMNETGSLVTSKPFKNVLNFPPLWTPTKGPFFIQTINFLNFHTNSRNSRKFSTFTFWGKWTFS